MKLSLIKQQLDWYDINKGYAKRKLGPAGDDDSIKALRALFPNLTPDRDLTQEELFKLFFTILLPDKKSGSTKNLLTYSVFQELQKSAGQGSNFLASIEILNNQELLTQATFNIFCKESERNVQEILDFWAELPAELKNLNNFLKISSKPSGITTVRDILNVRERRYSERPLSQAELDENFS